MPLYSYSREKSPSKEGNFAVKGLQSVISPRHMIIQQAGSPVRDGSQINSRIIIQPPQPEPVRPRESIHLQHLEIDSQISRDAIRLLSGDSKRRREIVMSHRHEGCQANSSNIGGSHPDFLSLTGFDANDPNATLMMMQTLKQIDEILPGSRAPLMTPPELIPSKPPSRLRNRSKAGAAL